MDSRTGCRYMRFILAATAFCSTSASSQAPDYIGRLHELAMDYTAKASPEALANTAASLAEITDCPSTIPDEDRSTATAEIDGVEYRNASVETEGGYCVINISPVGRPLTKDEAQDYARVITLMPTADIRSIQMRKRKIDRRLGEEQLKQLLDVVRSGNYELVDDQLPRVEAAELADCSIEPAEKLLAMGGGMSSVFIYNTSYTYKYVSPIPSGTNYCIYIDSPVGRGLSVEESYQFILATQVRIDG